jgi:hypothetical protein
MLDEWWVFVFKIVTALCLLVLSLVLCAVIYRLFLEILYRSRVLKQARRDYRAARGTQHLHQLRASFVKLQKSMRARKARIRETEQQLERLLLKRSEELHSTLSRHLVDVRLTEVQGIGPQLNRRIVQVCFRGNLRDLRFAHRVHGIGPILQQAINAWIQTVEAELPRLLDEDFPGKQPILDTYSDQEQSLQMALGAEHEIFGHEQTLREKARDVILRLQKVKPTHFQKALLQRSRKSIVPAWYFVGVFPPWQPMPEWFETLLKQYGG